MIRQALQYVATENKLLFYPVLLSEEDKRLLEVVKEHLSNPQKGIKGVWMSYELQFDLRAWKEWKKLDRKVQEQFKKRLAKGIEREFINLLENACNLSGKEVFKT